MTGIVNTDERYGWVAIAFHWIMAGLLIVLVAMGFYMVSLPEVGFDMRKITLILYHKELGVAAFVLFAMRLAWRITNALPDLVETLPDWQKVAARFVHLSFYALMFALPITGWLMSSAGGFPVTVLRRMTLPDLISYSDLLFEQLRILHRWLGYALTVLIFIHVGAALRHHFLLRDDTLRRMLPTSRR